MNQNKNRNQSGNTLGDFFSSQMKQAFDLPTEPEKTAKSEESELAEAVEKQYDLDDTTPNIGWLFYKDYYRFKDAVGRIRISTKNVDGKQKVEVQGLKDKNEGLFKRNLAVYSTPSVSNAQNFTLTTTYPGLLAGSGLAHAAGGQDEEFKLGFSFDHTSGLPYVPASSVKGVLRSLLKKLLDKAISDVDFQQFMAFVLENEKHTFTKAQLTNFINHSFGSQKQAGQDIFLDAFPISRKNKSNETVSQPFVGSDSITPHNKNPLKNPTPIAFFKILPRVDFHFSFLLKPYLENGKEVLGIEEKKTLFKNLLLNHGIGAKTNVGYGQFQ